MHVSANSCLFVVRSLDSVVQRCASFCLFVMATALRQIICLINKYLLILSEKFHEILFVSSAQHLGIVCLLDAEQTNMFVCCLFDELINAMASL